jgi:hypothetical protein
MNSKKIIIWSIIVCIILYLIPNVIYYCNFSNHKVSNSPGDWGVYGDFVGGSINPILTILNIIALVYLTYTVSDIEGKRMKESLIIEQRTIERQNEAEERRAADNIFVQKAITLSQMRQSAVAELLKELFPITDIAYLDVEGQKIKMGAMLVAIKSFKDHSHYLFEKLFNNDKFDATCYSAFILAVSDIYEYIGVKTTKENEGKIIELMDNHLAKKAEFIKALNKFIIDEMNEERPPF